MTRYLFDTSAMLLAGLEHERFKPAVRRIVADGDRYVSKVCAIEIAIKFGNGRLALPDPFKIDFGAAFQTMVDELSADVLDIELLDMNRLSNLPHIHRDPFDRLIISQAIGTGMTVVTSDRMFASYPGLDVLEI